MDKPRPGRAPKITGDMEAKLTLLACSDPPEGHARWTLRLLPDRMVELGLVENLSHVAIGERLKNTLKPWQVKQWCIPKPSAQFVAKREDVLEVYQRPYDPKHPVVCVDEGGKELPDTPNGTLPIEPGEPARQDYE